jgi:hypothetical protein
MRAIHIRRPSGSMTVAVLALVVADSRTAIAAGTLTSGDRLIAKRSLSGNRLRNHTIGGAQVQSSSLGKVPSAARADQATKATTAVTATNATNATNAANAANAANATNATNAATAANATNLGGVPATSFLTAANHVGTAGIVRTAGSRSGTGVLLFTTGPFTVELVCTKTATGTSFVVDAESTEANSVLNGTLVTSANTFQDLGSIFDINVTNTFASHRELTMDLEDPSGAQALVVGADGVNSLGKDCWANFSGLH